MKYLLKAILTLFGILPLKVQYINAKFLSFLLESVVRYRRDDVMVNFGKCITNKSIWELPELRHNFYQHLADLIVEAIWFGRCKNPRRLKNSHIVEVANPQVLARLYDNTPSVVVLYTHSGNWELLGGMVHYNYTDTAYPVTEDNFCVVYRELHSKTWDEIMRDNRFAPILDRKNFKGYIESKIFVRYVLTHRNEKKIYNVNTDQRPYYSAPDFIKVNFLNHECETMSAAASVAHKLGFSVVYQRMSIKNRGHYSIEYVPIADDASKMSVEDIMKEYYRLLEEDIKAQPANYLWTHRRWG